MKNLKWCLNFTLVNCILLAGCLEDKGEQQVKPVLNSTEFTVDSQPIDNTTEVVKRDDTVASSPEVIPICSDGVSSQTTLPVEGLVINQGEKSTRDPNLLISFEPPFDAGSIRFSETPDCSAGEWTNEYFSSMYYLPTSPTLLTNGLINGLMTLSVQFRDWDNMKSQCYTKQIIVDQQGPDIIFSKYPAVSVEEGANVEIVYNVSDTHSSIKNVSCEFAGITKTCPAGIGHAQFANLAEGDYIFKVIAIDDLNNTSEKSINFKVTSLFKRLVKSIRVFENQKVDILIVDDNSGSMESKQRSMANRVKNFIDVVHGLDWQIGVTTTDPRNNVYWGDGQLVPMKGMLNTYILNSAMSEVTTRAVLSNTIQRNETGSGLEQGILTTYRALERGQAGPGPNRELIREGAHLAVVLISDEDESANEMRNDPHNLLQYIQTTYKQQKNFSFHSIIIRPGDTQCLEMYESGGSREGFRFDTMARLTGGVIGNVCANDYAIQMQGIAEGVRKTLKTLTLSCEPIVNTVRSISITKDGQNFLGAYTQQGVNLVFELDLPQGDYQVDYSCTK